MKITIYFCKNNFPVITCMCWW